MGGGGAGLDFAARSSTSSCMFLFLMACGILLTRISRRVRRLCACNAACDLSLRARSATTHTRQYSALDSVLL